MAQRVAGIIQVQINGEIYSAKGSWTVNIGAPKREAVVGSDAVHGYKEMPQVPYVEGEITDRGTLSMSRLFAVTDATVTVSMANGKVYVLHDAWWAGDGNLTTEESAIAVRFEGMAADEI